jgi:hypothetical protein
VRLARSLIAAAFLVAPLPACSGDPAPTAARFCEINAELSMMDPLAGDLQAQIATGLAMRELLVEAVEVSPAEIEPEITATLEASDRVLEIVLPAATQGIDGTLLILATGDLEEAYAPVEVWVEANCPNPG